MNIFDLKRRKYIITGGAGFLGIQHARGILQHNGDPILIDISVSSLEKTKKILEEEFSKKILAFNCNICSEKEVKNLSNTLDSREIIIHGLINNAAINPVVDKTVDAKKLTRLEFFPIDQWEKEISVGLTGSFLCSKYFSLLMLKNKIKGVIINISSDLGLIAPDQRIYQISSLEKDQQPVKPITYSVIKTGLIGLSNYLATYFNGEIRSNAICPGGVNNNQDPEFVKKLEKLIPMRRMANKDELIGTIVFLLSDASSYINGAVISVDGGRTTW